MGNVKRKPADDEFSKCVRASANYTCERCGTYYGPGHAGLHCSHNFSRRHRTIRWCKENALSLCYGCHSWFGGNPADSGRWLEEKLGESALEVLREKRDSRVKVPKTEEKEIAAHYRKELKKIQSLIDGGTEPPYDFESWQ